MTISQLSIFAENKPGALYEISNALGSAGVDIKAMSIADSVDFGIFRLIVNDIEKAKDALAELGCIATETKVIAVAISHSPGALTDLLSFLSGLNINVEYMYAFVASSKENAYVVLRVEDNEEVINVLSKKGLTLLTNEEMKNL